MLKIRLRRMGSTHRPFFRVVVSDSRRTPTASAIEEVGFYDPGKEPSIVSLDLDRIQHWTSRGAQLSAAVRKLVRNGPSVVATPAVAEPAEAAAAKTEAEEAPPAAEAAEAEAVTAEGEAQAEPAPETAAPAPAAAAEAAPAAEGEPAAEAAPAAEGEPAAQEAAEDTEAKEADPA